MTATDRNLLRDLARRLAAVATLPEQAARRERWRRHNRLESREPMLLVFPEGSWRELLPDSALRCTDPQARNHERHLRSRLYAWEHFQDDTVVEPEWPVGAVLHHSGWGLEPRRVPSPEALGAWTFDPVIHRAADLAQLRFPQITFDAEQTARNLAEARDLFGDLLEVRERGVSHVSFHLMAIYTRLRGLHEVMLDMCDNPQMLHEAMAFLAEGSAGVIRQYEVLNLLRLNNDGTYHSSGGNGYTDELPAPGFDPNRVRPCDLWASAEAQEMAQVSPEMHAEFILAYEKPLLARFGFNGYGCCEDLTRKLDLVLTIPRLRRVSISPWADVEACAAALGDRAIFSWKPNPALLVGSFAPERIRAYLRHALDRTRGCVLEIVLKDTHTCENHPERFDLWTRIARQEIARG